MIWKMAEEPLAKEENFTNQIIKTNGRPLYPIGPANENIFAFYYIPCKKNVSAAHM